MAETATAAETSKNPAFDTPADPNAAKPAAAAAKPSAAAAPAAPAKPAAKKKPSAPKKKPAAKSKPQSAPATAAAPAAPSTPRKGKTAGGYPLCLRLNSETGEVEELDHCLMHIPFQDGRHGYNFVGGFITDGSPLRIEQYKLRLEPFGGQILRLTTDQVKAIDDDGKLTFSPMPRHKRPAVPSSVDPVSAEDMEPGQQGAHPVIDGPGGW